jgi:hypothetical protein
MKMGCSMVVDIGGWPFNSFFEKTNADVCQPARPTCMPSVGSLGNGRLQHERLDSRNGKDIAGAGK